MIGMNVGQNELPSNYPTAGGSPLHSQPLNSEGPTPFFPPVCLQSHWDPTQILKRTLPAGHISLPTDPRPWTRICMEYTTAGDNDAAPSVNPNIVLPPGGSRAPYGLYSDAIAKESELRRLDRPLGTCETDQWEPTLRSDMYDAHKLMPKRSTPSDPSRISEMAFPKALLRSGPYDCRSSADAVNVAMASDYMFNNATKQDRYKLMGKPTKAAPAQSLAASKMADMNPQLMGAPF